MTTAPKFVPDNNTPAAAPPEVPQWCVDAAKDIDIALRYEKPEPYSVSLVAEVIARHAPRPEKPATATAGEREERFDCETCGVGSYLPSGRCDHCDSFRDDLLRHVPQSYVPASQTATAAEAGEPEATTKWPRYFEPVNARGLTYRRIVDGACARPLFADGASDRPFEICLDQLAANPDFVETDAEGNALKQH